MALGYVPRGAGDGMMSITKAQAQALATFVSRIRDDWDHPGIVAAIEKAATLGTPAEIGTALCRLAANEEHRTPAFLPEPGQHWRDTSVASRVWPVMCEMHPGVRASRCDIDGPCSATVASADHATGAAAVRAAMLPRPRPVARREPAPADLTATRARADAEAGAS